MDDTPPGHSNNTETVVHRFTEKNQRCPVRFLHGASYALTA
jgi:hypothetical protein